MDMFCFFFVLLLSVFIKDGKFNQLIQSRKLCYKNVTSSLQKNTLEIEIWKFNPLAVDIALLLLIIKKIKILGGTDFK